MAASMPLCYHGALTKQESEEMLGKKNKDGAYLIRDSETIQGAMCLCVYKKKLVYTYRVLRTHSGNYTVQTAAGVEEKFFKTLDDLIHHFKRKDQGLIMHLRHSIKRKTALLIRQPRIEEPPSRTQESLHKLVEEDVEKTRVQLGQLQPLVDDECGLYANVDVDVEKTQQQLGQLQPLVDDDSGDYENVDVEKTQQQLGQLQPLVDDDYENVPGPDDYVDVLPP